ncbi:hypothetical protein [Bacteroides clarus]|uniref:hypothetical protein n=1 Tax=Bacteroides clarus TaxID=626929 RepID=UPI00266C5FB8|nr:hypothetical protein [Bacteroides clarus]
MKKALFICTLLTVLVGCAIKQTPRATFKREYKENRYEKMFQQADSMFNVEYGL